MAAVQRGGDILEPGAIVDAYRIRSVLGAGGFGVTYLAEHVRLGKEFALKEYFPRGYARRDGATVSALTNAEKTYQWGLDRFLQEARALAQFHHRAIVGVSNVLEANGTAYMVLSFERGRDMRAWRAELGRAPTQAEIDAILGDLLDALAELHRTGLLHRDIAPDNIYIRMDGSPVLLDFGAARHAIGQHSTQMSAIVKSGYSPPEQYTTEAKRQGTWSDIYAMGATLYAIVTGRPPPESALRMLGDTLVPAVEAGAGHYRPDFLEAIDDALQLVAANRPQSIEAWREKLLATEPVQPAEAAAATGPAAGEIKPAPAAASDGWAAIGKPPPSVRPVEAPSGPRWRKFAPAGLGALILLAAATMGTLALKRPAGSSGSFTANLTGAALAPACDQLASILGDPAAKAAGVPIEAMDGPRAVETCSKAFAIATPADRPRLAAQLGQALRVAGRFPEAVEMLRLASDVRYPEAQVSYADLLFDGVAPAPFDRKAACRLYEEASKAGSLNGTAGFAWCLLNGQGGYAKDEKRAVELYRQTAEKGSREANLYLGYLLRNGQGVPVNVPESIRLSERAAALGEARAYYVLAGIYASGIGVPLDRAKAAELYQKARPGLERMVAANHLDAMSVLGNMYREGNGIGRDEVAAARLYERAVALGSSSAMNHLADLYTRGAGVTQDFNKALELLRAAIARESEDAELSLAVLHQDGRGVPQNYAEAMTWFRRAADHGNVEAMVWIGNLFLNGHGVKQDHAEALRWYRRAADRNSANGMNSVGIMHELGQGTRKDFVEARRWYQKGAELGNGDAMRNLGELYENGNGVTKSATEAVSWYRRAVARENDEAMYRLGEMNRLGTGGIAIDFAEAMTWYRRAIEKGNGNATTALGLMFERGDGTAVNFPEAVRLYRQAADKGNAAGMYFLGLLYEAGNGVAKSCADARNWFQKASEAGDADAKKKLAEPAIRNCR